MRRNPPILDPMQRADDRSVRRLGVKTQRDLAGIDDDLSRRTGGLPTKDGRPVVTGSRGGNAALASLITALADLGLIVDQTT